MLQRQGRRYPRWSGVRDCASRELHIAPVREERGGLRPLLLELVAPPLMPSFSYNQRS